MDKVSLADNQRLHGKDVLAIQRLSYSYLEEALGALLGRTSGGLLTAPTFSGGGANVIITGSFLAYVPRTATTHAGRILQYTQTSTAQFQTSVKVITAAALNAKETFIWLRQTPETPNTVEETRKFWTGEAEESFAVKTRYLHGVELVAQPKKPASSISNEPWISIAYINLTDYATSGKYDITGLFAWDLGTAVRGASPKHQISHHHESWNVSWPEYGATATNPAQGGEAGEYTDATTGVSASATHPAVSYRWIYADEDSLIVNPGDSDDAALNGADDGHGGAETASPTYGAVGICNRAIKQIAKIKDANYKSVAGTSWFSEVPAAEDFHSAMLSLNALEIAVNVLVEEYNSLFLAKITSLETAILKHERKSIVGGDFINPWAPEYGYKGPNSTGSGFDGQDRIKATIDEFGAPGEGAYNWQQLPTHIAEVWPNYKYEQQFTVSLAMLRRNFAGLTNAGTPEDNIGLKHRASDQALYSTMYHRYRLANRAGAHGARDYINWGQVCAGIGSPCLPVSPFSQGSQSNPPSLYFRRIDPVTGDITSVYDEDLLKFFSGPFMGVPGTKFWHYNPVENLEKYTNLTDRLYVDDGWGMPILGLDDDSDPAVTQPDSVTVGDPRSIYQQSICATSWSTGEVRYGYGTPFNTPAGDPFSGGASALDSDHQGQLHTVVGEDTFNGLVNVGLPIPPIVREGSCNQFNATTDHPVGECWVTFPYPVTAVAVIPSVRLCNRDFRPSDSLGSEWPENFYKLGDPGGNTPQCRLVFSITDRQLWNDNNGTKQLIQTIADKIDDGTLDPYASATHGPGGSFEPGKAASDSQTYPDDVGAFVTNAELAAQKTDSAAINAQTNSEAGNLGEDGWNKGWFNRCKVTFYDPRGPGYSATKDASSGGVENQKVNSAFFIIGVGGATLAQGSLAPPATLSHVGHGRALNGFRIHGTTWLASRRDLISLIRVWHVYYNNYKNLAYAADPSPYDVGATGPFPLSPAGVHGTGWPYNCFPWTTTGGIKAIP